jgi:hypothetical protein
MRPVVPHEHGGWAFLAVPLLLGTWLGKPSSVHVWLFLAWLFFYMGSYAFREWLKRKRKDRTFLVWMLVYGGLGGVFFLYPLWKEPSIWLVLLLIIPSMIINVVSIHRKNERSMLNNLAAFHAFALGVVAAYVLGTGQWSVLMIWIYLHCMLFFVGITFFVKSILRERKNPKWMRYAKLYHWCMFLGPLLFGLPLLMVSYLFSLISLYRWGGTTLKPIQIGMIQMVNAIQFTFLTLWVI